MKCLTEAYKVVCCISDPKFPTPYNFNFGSDEDTIKNRLDF